ncbi:hypothetical protein TYRP_001159 [Tyrophagus putrescentiae]|nr:hypothetical protein TYRP_001159 [Tyrophagus putrescentiae]
MAPIDPKVDTKQYSTSLNTRFQLFQFSSPDTPLGQFGLTEPYWLFQLFSPYRFPPYEFCDSALFWTGSSDLISLWPVGIVAWLYVNVEANCLLPIAIDEESIVAVYMTCLSMHSTVVNKAYALLNSPPVTMIRRPIPRMMMPKIETNPPISQSAAVWYQLAGSTFTLASPLFCTLARTASTLGFFRSYARPTAAKRSINAVLTLKLSSAPNSEAE